MILTFVQEDLSSEPVLKIWALDKLVKKTNMPTCLSTLHISNGKKQFPVIPASHSSINSRIDLVPM